MNQGDEEEFVEILKRAMEVTGGPAISEGVLTAWWETLSAYPIEHVDAALKAHVAESVYPPKPADVIVRVGQADGRPGPEEAWGIALAARDENETVVWTPEIATAWGVCREILSAGDKIGARKAFLERYEREIAEARAERRPRRWTVSHGQDPDLRERAIKAAVDQGRLSSEQAAQHLPVSESSPVAGYLGSESGVVGDERARENLQHLRAMVSDAICEAPDPEIDEGVVERTRAWARRQRANAGCS